MRTFITFGAGNLKYEEAAQRLKKEIINTGLFDNTFSYSSQSFLLEDHSAFIETHSKFIDSNSRGYGYWLWKSYFKIK